MTRRNLGSQSGFTLLEILIVLLILTIVMGVVFKDIDTVQKRYRTEEAKLDITQESREFLDQSVRDLRQTGFPGQRLYAENVLGPVGAPPGGAVDQNALAAVGLVWVSNNDLVFEGDVDGSGVVWSVRYTLQPGPSGGCPCIVQRSQVQKVNGDPRPVSLGGQQGTTYSIQLENILNSGPFGFVIAGTTTFPNGGAQANDALYAAYKGAPLFSFFDANGIDITAAPNNGVLPLDATTVAGRALISKIRSVQVNLNVLSPTTDIQTGMRPGVSMTATARLTN